MNVDSSFKEILKFGWKRFYNLFSKVSTKCSIATCMFVEDITNYDLSNLFPLRTASLRYCSANISDEFFQKENKFHIETLYDHCFAISTLVLVTHFPCFSNFSNKYFVKENLPIKYLLPVI